MKDIHATAFVNALVLKGHSKMPRLQFTDKLNNAYVNVNINLK